MLKLPLNDKEFKEIVLSSGLVNKEDLEKAWQTAEALEKDFSDVLIEKSIITEEYLGQILADYFKVPFISLRNKVIDSEVLNLVSEEVAEKYQIIPFEKKKNSLLLAMVNPANFEAINFVQKNTGLSVVPHFIMPEDFRDSLLVYKKDIEGKFKKIIQENIPKTQVKGVIDLKKVATDIPIVKILDEIMDYAIALKSSDIHLEEMEDKMIIRFRVDGILRDIIELPKSVAPALVARIKVLASLKIDEQRLPQDGRFKYTQKFQDISLRVSVVPTFYGENISLRLLYESARAMNLSDLGIMGNNFEIVKKNLKENKGMILITGPTGCGKTTTLYSLINILNSPTVKICTIEDPIEYGIPRLTQIQINPKIGLTFASGLRSLLRHDPDIIMVGEIRDKETAEIATHAALTGHLVLSTLHTMDAPSAMPRLLEMGIPSYLATSTINLVISQRLARRICPVCIKMLKDDQEIKKSILKEYGSLINKKDLMQQKFYRGFGCPECGGSGYKGRIGVYEILEVDEEIEKLVLEERPTSEILKKAIKKGMTTLIQDGIIKASKGLIPLEEVLRLGRE